MIDGRFELWYGLIIMGLGIPVFIHLAMKYIRKCISKARKEGTPVYLSFFADADIPEMEELDGRRP